MPEDSLRGHGGGGYGLPPYVPATPRRAADDPDSRPNPEPGRPPADDTPSDAPRDTPTDAPGDVQRDTTASAINSGPATREEPEEPAVDLPDALPILPLKDTVVYPFAVVPLGVGKERSVKLIDEVMRGPRLVGLVAQKDADVEEAGPDDCFVSAPWRASPACCASPMARSRSSCRGWSASPSSNTWRRSRS